MNTTCLNKPFALIIDDELDTCLLIKLYLNKKGIETYQAHSLRDGLAQAALLSPRWVFLDNNLPDGLGLDNISAFRALLPETQIVMITALGKTRDIALELGANKFIEKPLSYAAIDVVIN
ncbi:response regulator [Flectobacillus major]|jgi:DNA-binding response OmpR family regulator|uniref:response regulator n=1 Tax=Flectobacillus major TaxID=103 RepID=UPI0004097776|nr:response regulator [Flectobacillus major]